MNGLPSGPPKRRRASDAEFAVGTPGVTQIGQDERCISGRGSPGFECLEVTLDPAVLVEAWSCGTGDLLYYGHCLILLRALGLASDALRFQVSEGRPLGRLSAF